MSKIVIFLLLGGIVGCMSCCDRNEEEYYITEDFIQRWLQNKNGTIATYIKENDEVDSEQVKGREALSETLGLWMIYAIEKEDEKLFNKAYKQFNKYFLESNGLIYWKINQEGENEVIANALIDDYRILDALIAAYDKWGTKKFMESAQLISGYLVNYNMKNGYFTDFHEQEYQTTSENITLSYIDPEIMNVAADRGISDKKITEATINVLKASPLRNGFYPKSFNVNKDTYSFDENINMVDQSITAYHQAKRGNISEEFLEFIKAEINDTGTIFGIYNIDTKKPIVDYESPAVYGFLILYCLEINEKELANDIYKRMKNFQILDKKNKYYGGYSVYNNDTHVFDNIVPLLAEQQLNKSKK
ncbi:MAG TPA: glycosyl hydrolase family 8 [Virgibacillus sp.]|nr:glycosyl hydrolase family 8 [Virgibacillus sp.]HLR69169.1 glycosyl hydrolase family 8 [Virgibacillus sp.]